MLSPQLLKKSKNILCFRRRTISRTTNDVVDEEETDENWLVKHRTTSSMSRESTPGKSLRFNVPKRLPPPEIVTPEEFSCEASTISPEKTLSYAEKSKQTSFSEKSLSHSEVSDIEKEEKPGARPEDDDSIVLGKMFNMLSSLSSMFYHALCSFVLYSEKMKIGLARCSEIEKVC